MKKACFIIFLLISLFSISFSQPSRSLAKLNSEIEKLKTDVNLANASWGIYVLSVKTGAVITEYNSNISLVPASTMKVITTGAALSILGTTFKYETTLEYDGNLDHSGTLNGNLYIRGSGDPTLDSELFREKKDTLGLMKQWAAILKQKGIKHITGAVVADARIFEDISIPPTWIWEDIGNYYGAGISGLSYKDNLYELFLKSGKKEGDSTHVLGTEPYIPQLEFINAVKAGGKKDSAYIFGAPYTYLRFLSGSIPAGKDRFGIKGSMPDPAWFCAYSLDTALKLEGIRIDKVPVTVREMKQKKQFREKQRTRIYSHYSPSLDRIAYYTNLKSNNLFAEHLLKTIGVKKTGHGTSDAGIIAIKEFWKSKGIDMKGFFMADGSGLSRVNASTVKQQAEILRVLSNEPSFTTFYNSLPVAGKSGTLTNICIGTCAENNLRAKSGSMTRVRAYSGYVFTKKGEQLAFSIIANNYDCSAGEIKRKMEKIMVSIAELE